MDTADLELAAKRYREAEEALEAAREDLQAEAVEALRGGVRQVDVVRITGWTREYLRRLRAKSTQGSGEGSNPGA
jgi:outer membrane protein TolC